MLVDFDDARQPAIKMGEAAGGQDVIVFVPDSPTPQTGSVMEAGRAKLTDIPVSKAFAALSSRGMGFGVRL